MRGEVLTPRPPIFSISGNVFVVPGEKDLEINGNHRPSLVWTIARLPVAEEGRHVRHVWGEM